MTAVEELREVFLLRSSVIPIPKSMSCLLISKLVKVLSRIQIDLVDNVGHRLQAVIPGFSFGTMNSVKSSACYHSAYFFREAMC